jgi:hypothetical protein
MACTWHFDIEWVSFDEDEKTSRAMNIDFFSVSTLAFYKRTTSVKIDQRHLPVSFEVKSGLFELHMSGVQCVLIPKFAKRPSTVKVNFFAIVRCQQSTRHVEEGRRD